MSCDHLSQCLRCGQVVEDLGTEIERLLAEDEKLRAENDALCRELQSVRDSLIRAHDTAIEVARAAERGRREDAKREAESEVSDE